MALATYRRKRNFGVTREPQGARTARRKGASFVVQKHAARRLHYDFRLEMDGVLKSWAVTRGPSLVPGEKRLAVHVEDHPLEYGDFEGTIPKGQYGGGAVLVWDRGTWQPIGDAQAGYRKGHLDFELQGEKLAGRWHLVRMAQKRGEKRENWLLIKGDDDAARDENAQDILEQRPESVKTGRKIDDVAAGDAAPADDLPAARPAAKRSPARAAAKAPGGVTRADMPDFVPPALATLRPKAPSGTRWVHEIKFDGYRIQAHVERGRVVLRTRTGLDWSKRFGRAIPEALGALAAQSVLIDGEIVVENAHGISDFSALQAALREGRYERMIFYGFDLLYLDGQDRRAAKLTERKAALEALLSGAAPCLRYSAHFTEPGDLVLQHACRLSLEGVVSKAKDSGYPHGRGQDWIKSKCTSRQEFVVAGFVPSSTTRRAIGSLVLGYYENGRLVHAGRVGTGFSAAVAADLYRNLEPRLIDAPAFAAPLPAEAARDAKFVKPELVAEVEFRGWTADRNLRHASFRGLREDKPPGDVVREDKGEASPAPAPKPRLTHPDRLYWPDEGVTKEGLANYYSDVWRLMAPFVVNRPLALVRGPDGVGGQCFFQKHAWKGLSSAVKLVPDPRAPDAPKLLVVHDFEGLNGLVQAGVLEIHPWGATLRALEQPDMITMDLDPGPGIGWGAIVSAARDIRDRLQDHGLASFVKTSGGKGLHVVAPLKPHAEWPAVKAFCKTIADTMAAEDPEKYVAVVTKSKREGRILVDYLRNGRGATSVAAYSARARPTAAVSMPVAWEELDRLSGADHFTIMNAPARLASLASDPWADFAHAAVPLAEQPAPRSSRRATR